MEIQGKSLIIESEKRVGVGSFCDFIARRLMECIEESGGDFTRLDTSGAEWIFMILNEYEAGGR